MATQTVTATFKAISDEAINASGQVINIEGFDNLNDLFDLLVQVEWLSGPKAGEKGKLLCSHYCKWPQELLDEADFIEGCFTPVEFIKDRRLVLGYHPGTVTSYQWVTTGEIVTICTNLERAAGSLSLTFQRGEDHYVPTSRAFRRAQRLCSRIVSQSVAAHLTPAQGFSALEQRFENGELPFLGISPFLFSYMLNALEVEGVTPNGALSVTLPEYGEYCEVNGDIVTVIRKGDGFSPPSALPYLYEEGTLTITRDMPHLDIFKASTIRPSDWIGYSLYWDGEDEDEDYEYEDEDYEYEDEDYEYDEDLDTQGVFKSSLKVLIVEEEGNGFIPPVKIRSR